MAFIKLISKTLPFPFLALYMPLGHVTLFTKYPNFVGQIPYIFR